MLDLKQLRVLRAVTESGSMTRAAEQLSYTPSAVSQQMAALERQLGARLLVRHARGVRPTEVARVLIDRTATIEGQLRCLEQDVQDMINGRGGRLRMIAFSSAANRLLPPAIDAFRRDHPEVSMTLDIRDLGAVLDAVVTGAADVAVAFDYPDRPLPLPHGLRTRPLGVDPVFVAVPTDHPAAGRRCIGIAELADTGWIRDCSPDPACRELLERLCAAAGYRPKINFESDDYLAIGRLVAAGVGVALVPGLAAEQMPAGVTLCEIDPTVTRRITVLRSTAATPVADRMVDILAEVAADVTADVTAYRAAPTGRRSA